MIWIDYGIIGLISLFAISGLLRGFATEIRTLIVWMVAFAVGLIFSQDLALRLRSLISDPSLVLAAAFALLFLLTVVVGRLLGSILSHLQGSVVAAGSERFGGLVVGAGRGVLLVAIIVMLAGLSPLPRDPWWRESNLISPFQSLVLWVQKNYQSGIAVRVNYRH
ncbi:MAG: CvpA family protein [Gammaproteobacteria bacterium]